jgi:hypothetical protein
VRSTGCGFSDFWLKTEYPICYNFTSFINETIHKVMCVWKLFFIYFPLKYKNKKIKKLRKKTWDVLEDCFCHGKK